MIEYKAMCFKPVSAVILTLFVIVNVRMDECHAKFAWEFHCGTWNMQGAQVGELPSWSRLSKFLGYGYGTNSSEVPISVMALQESGELPPPTARFLSNPDVHFMVNTRQSVQATDRITEYEWPTGSTSRTGPTYETQRTNLAVLSL